MMIPMAKPYIGEEEKKAVEEVLESRMLAQGPRVKELEARFAEFVGTEHAIAASSGTTALYLALLAMGVGEGDEVITTPTTFFATASTIVMAGAKPIFTDIERDTLNLDPEKVREAVTPKTKAIVPVHLYGLSTDMKPIMEVAEREGISVLEDACQSHGATYDGEVVGGIGDAGCFSFYPTKNMMAGEGGMVTTDDDDIAEKVRLLRSHGSPRRYVHTELGYNYRMTDICAAIGLCQLQRLEGFNEKRRENARELTGFFNGIDGLTTPCQPEGRRHVYHQYALVVEDDFPMDRDALAEFLQREGVGSDKGYTIPIYKQPVFQKYPWGGGECPVAEEVTSKILLLPVHPALSEADVKTMERAVEKAAGN